MDTGIRLASYNASLNRATAGQLIEDLSTSEDTQAKAVAEIIQRTNPDVLLINEFDYDPDGEAAALFQENYLSVSQNGVDPVEYPYVYVAPSNTGISSGFDLDNNGQIVDTAGTGYGNDSFGFGDFSGQFAFVIYSKYPIVKEQIRTFQKFLWADMPGALLPEDPDDVDGDGDRTSWYSPEELDVFRLSSKNHVDLPIEVNGEIIHILASHPTPPTFDGPEDRNGTRNHDEIRFWADYIRGKNYIYDDNGTFGGLKTGDRFVIMGDQNADPNDGDSVPGAAQQILEHPLVNASTTPSSEGGVDAAVREGGANSVHVGDPAFDTANFGFNADDPSNDNPPGNLRVDYVLPSANLQITDAQVFWLPSDDPLFPLGEFPTSDHRLVAVDVLPTQVAGITFLGETTFPSGFEYDSTIVGGLSSITYNAVEDAYYTISDDQSVINDARVYTLHIDLSDGALDEGDISFTDVTPLLDQTRKPYASGSVDPEGLAYNPKDNTLFFSSEGFAQPTNIVNPFIKEISLTGEELQVAEVRSKYYPVFKGDEQVGGVRNNAGFESLTITPDQTAFFTANEDTLAQDGDRTSLDQGGTARIIKYDLETLQPQHEFLFELAPIVEPSNPADAFKLQGVVELLALDNDRLLVLERSFSIGGENGQGTGFTGLLYEVDLAGAIDVSALDSIEGVDITPVKKTLLLNTEDLGLPIDNIEGMTLGSVLPNGNQSLVIVADNDFSDTRSTQFFAFELTMSDMNTTQSTPLVIGHRGASGTLPEHTLEAYKLAIEQGADFIEPDLVVTKDGVLIARHEPTLAQVELDEDGSIKLDENGHPILTSGTANTTNVFEFPEFADRLTVKTIDGTPVGGWYAEDFTLEEIKQLSALQSRDYRDQSFNDDGFKIPTFAEVIAIAKENNVGIYPETKHPTYFWKDGTYLDGTPINVDTSQLLIDTLVANDFTDPDQIFIQSFEIENLIRLQKEIMPDAGIDIPLVQLTDDFNTVVYDVAFNFEPGNPDANPEIYDGIPVGLHGNTDYGDLLNTAFIDWIADNYAEGLGPWKETFRLTKTLAEPVDGDGDGVAEITKEITGQILPIVDWAHDAGLQVHTYTMRDEERHLYLVDGEPETAVEEYLALIDIGVDGFFTDFPATAVSVVNSMSEGAAILSMAIQLVFGGMSSSRPSSMKVSR